MPVEYGVNSSSPNSPGLGGAIKDAIGAVQGYFRASRAEAQASREGFENKVINGEAGKEDTRIPSHEVDAETGE